MNLLKEIESQVKAFGTASKNWIVAYSGGVDSRVLVDSLAKIKPSDISLKMIHVHHGLSKHADEWESKARSIAKDIGAEIHVAHLNMKDESGVEEKARDLRYDFIMSHMEKDDIVFMGHHKNDNAETLLFRMFRGTGIKGMSGIPLTRPMGKGNILRPMLNISRKEIVEYALNNKLEWVEDDSNADSVYSRNFIRNEVLPLIESRWRSALSSITAFTSKAAEAEELALEIAKEDLEKISFHDKDKQYISVEKLLNMSHVRIKNVLLYYIGGIEEGTQETKTFNNALKVLTEENKNCSKVRKLILKKGVIFTNGKKIWFEE